MRDREIEHVHAASAVFRTVPRGCRLLNHLRHFWCACVKRRKHPIQRWLTNSASIRFKEHSGSGRVSNGASIQFNEHSGSGRPRPAEVEERGDDPAPVPAPEGAPRQEQPRIHLFFRTALDPVWIGKMRPIRQGSRSFGG